MCTVVVVHTWLKQVSKGYEATTAIRIFPISMKLPPVKYGLFMHPFSQLSIDPRYRLFSMIAGLKVMDIEF